jgi:UDP-N-acetylglucosamine acyltransferase
MPRIHPSAIVDAGVELGRDVEVGPFCHLHAGVRIGDGTRLMSHVVVAGETTIGRDNVVFPFAVLGGEAQVRRGSTESRDVSGWRRGLEIGDGNVFRESVTVNTARADGVTRVGSHNLFMGGCHVAHDVAIGSHCVFANAVQIAGHVAVGDWVTFGGLSAVAQRLRVGESAFVAGGAMCERDVPPFVIVQGDRARVRALNVVGLGRRGVPADSVLNLKTAFAALYVRRRSSFAEAVTAVDRSDPYVARLASFLGELHRSRR